MITFMRCMVVMVAQRDVMALHAGVAQPLLIDNLINYAHRPAIPNVGPRPADP